VSDGEGHGEDGESEGERDTGEADAEGGVGGGEYGASAAAEDEPECADELRGGTLGEMHERTSI
jgi:hypothetical protein